MTVNNDIQPEALKPDLQIFRELSGRKIRLIEKEYTTPPRRAPRVLPRTESIFQRVGPTGRRDFSPIRGLLLHSIYHQPNGRDYVSEGSRISYGESCMRGDCHVRGPALCMIRINRGQQPGYTFFGAVGNF
jgi:hypothetical protein